MSTSSPNKEHLGFLTVVDQARLGLIGGFLIVNAAGRPLEFHCTTPVKANRAQEILYGSTLEPYLYGEQIARTLIARAKITVKFVVTNAAPVLSAQDCTEPDILYVFGTSPAASRPASTEEVPAEKDGDDNGAPEESPANIEISEELNASLKTFGIENARLQTGSPLAGPERRIPEVPGFSLERWREFKIGNRFVALPGETDEDRDRLFATIKELSRTIDLAEPFTRIRMAIEEAQRAA